MFELELLGRAGKVRVEVAAERLREDDPSALLDTPKLPRPLPKYLSEDEVDRLLAAAHAMPDAAGLRAAGGQGDEGGRLR